MDDIPIFAKAYELFKLLSRMRNGIPKSDRHALWQRIENTCLTMIESLFQAGQRIKSEKSASLTQASTQLNMLRMFVRLAKDTKVIDLKKYAVLQQTIDEIGRMLGGWIKSVHPATPPPHRNF